MSEQHLFSPPNRAERDQIRSILHSDRSCGYEEWEEIQKRRYAEALFNQVSSKQQYDTSGTSPLSPLPPIFPFSSFNMLYIDDAEFIRREQKKAVYRAELQQQMEEQKQRKLEEREERRRPPPSPTPPPVFRAPQLDASMDTQPPVFTSNIKAQNIDSPTAAAAALIKKTPYINTTAIKKNEKNQDSVGPTIVDAIKQAEASRLAETKAKMNSYKQQQWKEAEDYRVRKEQQHQQEKVQQAWEDEKTEKERVQQQVAYEKEQQRLKVKMQGHSLSTATVEDIIMNDHIEEVQPSSVVDVESRKRLQENDDDVSAAIPPQPPPPAAALLPQALFPPPLPPSLPTSSYNVESERALELAALLSDALSQHAAEVRSLKTRAERAEITSTAASLKVDALIGEIARMKASAAISAAATVATTSPSSSQYLHTLQPPPLQYTSTNNNNNDDDDRALPIFQTSVTLAPIMNSPINSTTAAPPNDEEHEEL